MSKMYWFLIFVTVIGLGYLYQPLSNSKGKSMNISSISFSHNGPLDIKYTLHGQNIAPHLAWDNLPQGTKSLALIVDDPDAPTPQPWVHAVGYNIDSALGELKEGGWPTMQGATDFSGKSGYQGPKPPKGHGVHHYHFKLYALDQMLDLKPGASKSELENAMKGHMLSSAEIIGTFEAP